MSLESVVISWDAFTPCLSHALSNEKQEIMGLLLGSVKPSGSREGREIAIIKRSIVLQRKDKKADRVEVGSEYLALASTIAEKVSAADIETTGDIKVLGWYHSHPHITVLPSHVDVGTQGRYQRYVDNGFVGLILSVFDRGNIEICAFQSRQVEENGPWEGVEVPISLQLCTKVDVKVEEQRNILLPGKISLETIYAMQKALLNEDASAFAELYKGFQMRPPATFVSRNSLAYQTALMRSLDLQVAPLQNAVTSKRASLELEKRRLLAKLEVLQGSKDRESMEFVCDAMSPSSRTLLAFEKVQNALDLTATIFKERSHIFQTFFLEGLGGKILTTTSTNLLQVNEEVVIMLQPHIDVSYSHTLISTSISPWQMVLKKAGGKRETIGYLMDVRVLDDELDFHVSVDMNGAGEVKNLLVFSLKPTDSIWPIDEEHIYRDRDAGHIARILQLFSDDSRL